MSNGAMDGTFRLTCRQHRRCEKCRPVTAAPPTSGSRDVKNPDPWHRFPFLSYYLEAIRTLRGIALGNQICTNFAQA